MALARSTDPVTSHEAASEAEGSGRARIQRDRCLASVLDCPGRTAAEVAAATGLERHAPSRRLPELRDAGLIANGRARICKVTGRLSITWFPSQEVRP